MSREGGKKQNMIPRTFSIFLAGIEPATLGCWQYGSTKSSCIRSREDASALSSEWTPWYIMTCYNMVYFTAEFFPCLYIVLKQCFRPHPLSQCFCTSVHLSSSGTTSYQTHFPCAPPSPSAFQHQTDRQIARQRQRTFGAVPKAFGQKTEDQYGA
jgi:hypothetical protein